MRFPNHDEGAPGPSPLGTGDGSSFGRRPYLSTVEAMELFEDALERLRLRYIHRNPGSPAHELCALGWNPGSPAHELCALGWNPVKLGLVTKPEEWLWSSYRHYQTGMHGAVEIESEWTACERGWQLPERMRYRQFDSTSPVPKGEGPGAPST